MLYLLLNNQYIAANEADVIAEATEIYSRYFKRGTQLTCPSEASDYIRLKLIPNESEVFLGLFMDAQHRIIACEDLFFGTISEAMVYPREVIKKALFYNAASVIFAHNHPSGLSEPSQADIAITSKLEKALQLIEVKLLDHFICGEGIYSIKEGRKY